MKRRPRNGGSGRSWTTKSKAQEVYGDTIESKHLRSEYSRTKRKALEEDNADRGTYQEI